MVTFPPGGQPVRGQRARRAPRRSGYTMVALLVGITVMSIMIAAVLPLASTEMQRERETELIFRGLQYAEGIRNFRRKYGRYPNSLREMLDVKPRTLRKLWADPITDSQEWGLVSLVQQVPGVQPGGVPGKGGLGPGGSGLGDDKGGKGPQPTPSPTPDHVGGPRGGSGGAGGRGGQEAPAGPVLGVYSRSTKTSMRLWQGRDKYNEWRFTEQSLGMTPGGFNETPGGGPGPGVGGGGPVVPPGGGPGPGRK